MTPLRVIVVEGNYVLLDAPGWRDLAPLFDVTVTLRVDWPALEARLLDRWRGYGLEGEAMLAKMEGNDLPNARLVVERSLPADYVLETATNA